MLYSLLEVPRRRTLIVALACWFAVVPLALADPPPAYQAAVHSAVAEFQARNWKEALILFKKAHRLFPSARTHRGLGLAYFELRDHPPAVRHFDLALGASVRPLTGKQRTEALRILATARALVGELSLSVFPENATVLLEGKPQGWKESPLLLNAGDHRLVVEAPGHVRFSRVIEVPAEELTHIEVSLEPIGGHRSPASIAQAPVGRSIGVATPVRPTSVAQASVARSTHASTLSTPMSADIGGAGLGPYLVVAAGGLMLGGAAVTGILTSTADQDLKDVDCQQSCAGSYEDIRSTGKTMKFTTNVLLLGGAVTLAGGALWWWLDGGFGDGTEGDATQPEIQPLASCDPYSCMAVIKGVF